MRVEFETECGSTTYAPPEEAYTNIDRRKFVWCRTENGNIKPAFMD